MTHLIHFFHTAHLSATHASLPQLNPNNKAQTQPIPAHALRPQPHPRNPHKHVDHSRHIANAITQLISPLCCRREKTIYHNLAASTRKRVKAAIGVISSNNHSTYNNDASDRKMYDALAKTNEGTDGTNKGKHNHLINETKWTTCYKSHSGGLFTNQDEYQDTMRAIISKFSTNNTPSTLKVARS